MLEYSMNKHYNICVAFNRQSMLAPLFQQLGFTEKEAQIYQLLIELGPSPASTLARLAKIKRTTIYDSLANLQNRNLIYSYRQGKYTYFAIDDFKKIYLEEKEKLKAAETLITKLKEKQQSQSEVQIYYYRGEEGYRELYEDILKANPKEILAWINLDDFYKFLDPKREVEWTKERVNKKIPAKIILEKTPLSEKFASSDAASLRQTRLIPKVEATCFIYNNYVVFFDPSGSNPSGIRIHNPAVAKLQKMIFDQNWNALFV